MARRPALDSLDLGICTVVSESWMAIEWVKINSSIYAEKLTEKNVVSCASPGPRQYPFREPIDNKM